MAKLHSLSAFIAKIAPPKGRKDGKFKPKPRVGERV